MCIKPYEAKAILSQLHFKASHSYSSDGSRDGWAESNLLMVTFKTQACEILWKQTNTMKDPKFTAAISSSGLHHETSI